MLYFSKMTNCKIHAVENLSAGTCYPTYLDICEPKKIVAIEIKAGKDIANIHNRLGEAEKSHQKAKLDAFSECWTIINVDLDYSVAGKETPSTNRFYKLSNILDTRSDEFVDFKDQIISITGIPNSN